MRLGALREVDCSSLSLMMHGVAIPRSANGDEDASGACGVKGLKRRLVHHSVVQKKGRRDERGGRKLGWGLGMLMRRAPSGIRGGRIGRSFDLYRTTAAAAAPAPLWTVAAAALIDFLSFSRFFFVCKCTQLEDWSCREREDVMIVSRWWGALEQKENFVPRDLCYGFGRKRKEIVS